MELGCSAAVPWVLIVILEVPLEEVKLVSKTSEGGAYV